MIISLIYEKSHIKNSKNMLKKVKLSNNMGAIIRKM